MKHLDGGVVTLRSSEDCFACGRENAAGLHLSFTLHPDRQSIETEWLPPKTFQSYSDVLHGGFVALLLDEVMGKLAMSLGMPAVTADLSIRYLKPVPTGRLLRVRGWIVEAKRRVVTAQAEALLEDGTPGARATAKLMRVRP